MQAMNQTDTRTAPRAVADDAYRTLRADILYGALLPGERLRVADLRSRYGLGLTPIREALTRLGGEGLIETEAHHGARVRPLARDELGDLMRTRRQIERLCLSDAIARGDAAWEAEILRALHLLARTPLPGNPEDFPAARLWEERHRAFHLALVAACGSDWLLRFWHVLSDHSERYRKVRLLHHDDAAAEVRDIPGEHRALAEAAIDRDAAAACQLLDAHLAATERSVDAILARIEGA